MDQTASIEYMQFVERRGQAVWNIALWNIEPLEISLMEQHDIDKLHSTVTSKEFPFYIVVVVMQQSYKNTSEIETLIRNTKMYTDIPSYNQ